MALKSEAVTSPAGYLAGQLVECSKSVPKVYLIDQIGFYFERKQIP